MSSIIFLFTTLSILASVSSWTHQNCYQIEEIEHGFVQIVHRQYYQFSCERGYKLRGETYIACNDYSRTTEKPKCIKNTCENPTDPQNGQVVCDEGPHFQGKKCYLSCFNGYQVQGYNRINCQSNLQWSGFATCYPTGRTRVTEEVCEKPPSLENGKMECDEGDLTIGKACRFSCSVGYKLQGTNLRRCMYNNQWSGNVKCVPVSGHSYPVPADDSRRNQERENVASSPYGTRNYNPSNEVILRGSCQNLHCQQLCLNEATGPRCRCCPGYMLTSNNKTCYLKNAARVNMNECLRKYNKVGQVVLRPCPERYTFDYDSNGCIDIDECSMNTFDCSPGVCRNVRGSAHCVCPIGFTQDKDQKRCTVGCRADTDCDFDKACINNQCIDPCASLTACATNAYCDVINHSIHCTCPSGLTGDPYTKCNRAIQRCDADDRCGLGRYCEDTICRLTCSSDNECLDNEKCIERRCSVSCTSDKSCPTGFICEYGQCIAGCRRDDECPLNLACINNQCLNPCASQTTCGTKAQCQPVNHRPLCSCLPEHTGDPRVECSRVECITDSDCGAGRICQVYRCLDINECLTENRCNHFCNNTVGSYFCSCKPGYILIEGYRCEGCKRNSYWSYETNACVDCPKNSHTNSEGKTSINDCVCNLGFEGSPGDYISCTDIDECSIDNFGCSDDCVNIPGGAYCFCPKGFMLDTDNKTCIDINECDIKNGGCEGLCINTKGNFTCVCGDGFTESTKDRYSCDDIDECAVNNGGCEHLCINYLGGFYCVCKEGYHLDSTLKNCTEARCSKHPSPHYTYMDCTYKNVSLPEQNSYPVGTKCIFRCNRGFKNAKDGKALKCFKDGSWKGVLPECKPESCPPLDVPENGKVHPPSCSQYGAATKQKCTFSCHAGYVLKGGPVFVCRNDRNWNKDNIPVCNPVKILPKIKCPDDIRVVLLQGKSTHKIIVPEPIADTEDYDIFPSWVTTKEPVEFPVGLTHVTFTAISTFNETAQCDMTVTVLDEEPPTFHFCPDSIIINDAKGTGEFVTWDDPIVSDNVELVSVFSLLEPNRTFVPGTYFVEYVARDSSGNVGTCSFEISIMRVNCTDLKDPFNGKANCMDWMFGKLCNPECEDGYMRDPEDPPYYSCDDTGIWEPNDSISECLRYYQATSLANSSICADDFQLKKIEATGEEICIECPQNKMWSPTTRKCEKITGSLHDSI